MNHHVVLEIENSSKSPGGSGGAGGEPRWRSSEFAVAELVEVACALANGGVRAAQWGQGRFGRSEKGWDFTEPLSSSPWQFPLENR